MCNYIKKDVCNKNIDWLVYETEVVCHSLYYEPINILSLIIPIGDIYYCMLNSFFVQTGQKFTTSFKLKFLYYPFYVSEEFLIKTISGDEPSIICI